MIKQIVEKILLSFESNKGGYSARKLTSFVVVCLVVYGHFEYLDRNNFIEALIVDYLFIGLLLGLVTFAQIIELKHEIKKEDNDS